jgi:hypothetical protein
LNTIVGLKEKIQKVYNEDDNLALKAIPKEHSTFTLELSLVAKFNYSKLFSPLP